MNNKIYNSRLMQSSHSNRSLKMMIGVLLLTNLIQAFTLMQKNEKTIILPRKVDRMIAFDGEDTVSDSYLELMTNYFSSKLLNYNKSNAEYQFSEVLHYVEPGVYELLKIRFEKDVERIERDNIGNVFYPMGINISKKKRVKDNKALGMGYTVQIIGEERSYIGTQRVNKPKKNKIVTYQFTYKYEKGIFSLLGYKLAQGIKK